MLFGSLSWRGRKLGEKMKAEVNMIYMLPKILKGNGKYMID